MAVYLKRVRSSVGHIHEASRDNFETLRSLDRSVAGEKAVIDNCCGILVCVFV